MKLFQRMKDGGPESRVFGYFLVEAKKMFSVVLIQFLDGSREAFHSHAFNSLSWVLRGELQENLLAGGVKVYRRSFKPILTTRETFHKVVSVGTTWVLSFRGPWASTWKEYLPEQNKFQILTHGRQIVAQ